MRIARMIFALSIALLCGPLLLDIPPASSQAPRKADCSCNGCDCGAGCACDTLPCDTLREAVGQLAGTCPSADEYGRYCNCIPTCRCPDCKYGKPSPISAAVGGKIAPDGKSEIQIDLPGNLHRRNTSSRGLGLCVFTSLHHAATWQNVPALQEFPKYLIDKGIAGGGWPQKVAELVAKISKDRGLPEPDYVQVEGDDLEILKLACATGRMPGVTYSRSPTGRYGGQQISHMVNLAHMDDTAVAVLDNNYIGVDAYEWMSPQEFRRTYTGIGGGWSVILLNPGPPPDPKN